MDLLILITFILLILILMKVSSVASRLDEIERLLKKSLAPQRRVEEKTVKTVVSQTIKEVPIQSEKPLKVDVPKLTKRLSISDIAEVKEKYEKSKIKVESKSKPEPKTPTLQERFSEKFGDVSLEEFLFGNIILKIAIVAFILGIGLFLKYSIDKDWIPIWGRVLIGIAVGIAMLVAGIKMINNRHKLFSESLFGGGIAVLYLSVFAAFALEGFMFISSTYAYVAMIIITILAGVISVRFDAKSTAVFGLIGGFATPFLLSTGSGNYVGLLSYMLMLNLGVLFISIYKKWSLLSWMAFAITSATALLSVWETVDDFKPLAILYASFFIIYSIVPFINEIRGRQQALEKPFVFLFWANFVVAILSYLALFEHYNIDLLYYAVVTVVLAGYLLVYASVLAKKNVLLKNLFYIVLAQSIALLLVTPAFIFEGSSLTIVWAVESLMLLWIATKSNEATYALFTLFGFAITVLRYFIFDIVSDYDILAYMAEKADILEYVQSLAITSLFVIGSLFAGYKLLKNSSLDFKYVSTELVRWTLFMGTFLGAYLVLTFMSSLLSELYYADIFSMVYMLIIALFAFILYKSTYAVSAKVIFYIFLGLLIIGFVDNIIHISGSNTMISLVNFLLFMAVVGFIYTIAFKESKLTISNYQLSHLMLGSGVGLLFIFLNVEVYHLVKIYSPAGTKFAITLLWISFGITLFVYSIIKDVKVSKLVGTVLILLAILKAFFVDLANLDSIYRILLFLILGAILFGLSYFYQSKNKKDEK